MNELNDLQLSTQLAFCVSDIYVYLTNQTTEQNESSTAIATDLINRCKDILNIYETEHDSKLEQAYLEMNGNSKIGMY